MLGKLCRNVNTLLGEATTDPFLEILELSAFDILYAILEYCHILHYMEKITERINNF